MTKKPQPPVESPEEFRARTLKVVGDAVRETAWQLHAYKKELVEERIGVSPKLPFDPTSDPPEKYASLTLKELSESNPQRKQLPRRARRDQWERECEAWANARRYAGGGVSSLASARLAAMCGDAKATYQDAFYAGYCLAQARLALITPVIEGRRQAAAASRNTSTGLSKLTQAERLSIGRIAYEKLVLNLRSGLVEDDARARAYDAAYAWGAEEYGAALMPKRNAAYPKRYMDTYVKQYGLSIPAVKE